MKRIDPFNTPVNKRPFNRQAPGAPRVTRSQAIAPDLIDADSDDEGMELGVPPAIIRRINLAALFAEEEVPAAQAAAAPNNPYLTPGRPAARREVPGAPIVLPLGAAIVNALQLQMGNGRALFQSPPRTPEVEVGSPFHTPRGPRS